MSAVVTKKLPEGWQWSTMEDIADVIGGGTPKSKEKRFYDDGEIPWLTPADLSGYKNKYVSRGRRNITEEGLNSSSAKLMPAGSVLFTSRAPIGYVVIASNEICTNQGFKSFVMKSEDILPDYVYWWLKGNKQLAESVASGTTFLELSGAKAKKLPIPIAPPEQQKRIVAKIEELFSHIDAGIEALKKAKQLLKQYRQSFLKAAVTGELTKEWREANSTGDNETVVVKKDILRRIEERFQEKIAAWEAEVEVWKSNGSRGRKPKKPKMRKEPTSLTEDEKGKLPILPTSWEWIKLGELAETITKGASPKWQGINYVDDSQQVLFVTSENVREGYIDIDTPKYLEIAFNEKQPNSVLKENDLLINIVGASIGRAARFETDMLANINQAVSLVRVPDDSLSEFLKFYLNSMIATNYYSENQVDVARANLSLVDIQNIPIPLCGRNEVLEILNSIQSKFDSIDRLESELSTQQSKAEKNKQSILASAFSGGLI